MIEVGTTRATTTPNIGELLVARSYQERIVQWGLRDAPDRKGLWAVDLGLGKTAAALRLIVQSLWEWFDTSRWLVVAPKLVAQDTWPTQLTRWGEFKHLDWRVLQASDFGLEPGVVWDTGKKDDEGKPIEEVRGYGETVPAEWTRLAKTGLQFRDKRAVKRALLELKEHVHVVSWDFFPYLVQAYGRNWPYDGMVLDESTFAQSSTGLRHRAAWHVIQRLQRVARVIELTGLPTPNGRQSLHGQVRLLDGGQRLGKTKTEFQEQWLVPDRMDRRSGRVWSWKVAADRIERMDQALADIAVSLRSDDWLALPRVLTNDVLVPLPAHAQAVYAALERDLVASWGDGGIEVVAASQGVLVGKLLQVCSGAVYGQDSKSWELLHDAKLDRLAEIIEAATEPLIVCYGYGHEWQRLRARFPGIVDVTGKGVLAKFKAGKVPVMAGHPGSFGHGVDGLQDVCHQVVWFGATYNLEHWVQVIKRLHRDGQKRPVILTRLLAAGTLEEQIAGVVLPDKREASDLLLDALRLRVSGANMPL